MFFEAVIIFVKKILNSFSIISNREVAAIAASLLFFTSTSSKIFIKKIMFFKIDEYRECG